MSDKVDDYDVWLAFRSRLTLDGSEYDSAKLGQFAMQGSSWSFYSLRILRERLLGKAQDPSHPALHALWLLFQHSMIVTAFFIECIAVVIVLEGLFSKHPSGGMSALKRGVLIEGLCIRHPSLHQPGLTSVNGTHRFLDT